MIPKKKNQQNLEKSMDDTASNCGAYTDHPQSQSHLQNQTTHLLRIRHRSQQNGPSRQRISNWTAHTFAPNAHCFTQHIEFSFLRCGR
ncbi:hypothetical protein SCLCIDRAFT_1222077 [Scleroderma citrinum Foug A]|uniref:Uncharacterized protein n=1 Tax=Scleroderma citrinum Foug A TaxID=1036808 RepID=A0A0C3DD95_9AGAM|nr:hypothetical protein SCLCIDRAFT_1222077 [Scleroderma citrinum Foug A]